MRKSIYAVAAVFLLGLGVWWYSPEQILKRRTLSLLDTLTMAAGDGKNTRQFAIYSLNSLLAEEVELENPTLQEANGRFERPEMESAFSWLARQAKETRFEVLKWQSITTDGQKGTTILALEGRVELPHYRPVDGEFDAQLEWVNEKDGWRLVRAVWNKRP
jgi:hypothetical protein